MKKFSLEHIERLRSLAKREANNKRWGGEFDDWWDFILIERMDILIPFRGYWDAVYLIQKTAWDEELEQEAEGK